MKKIVRGNDFTLRIPVKKIVNGEQVSFPLTDCTDIAVHVVSKYKRTALPYTIDKESNDVLLADVDGTTLSLGTYALEVTGVLEGANWRSYEYEQFAIVDNNASSDTVFEGNTANGDTNIEGGNGDNTNKGCMDVKIEGFAVDTALVVLPPVSARATIIELIANADAAIAAVRETEAAVKASEDVRVESETLRQSAEEQRAESEATRQTAETLRTESEMERVANEEARKANEEARVAAEEQRAATFTELSEAANAAVGKADEAVKSANAAIDKTNVAESERAEAERQRAEAEAARSREEGIRQESETERVRQETARETAETTRQNAEVEREKADAEREKRVSEAISNTSSAAKTATDAADVATETAKKAMVATTEAERVNAELRGNVLTVTDRTGEVKTLDLMDQEEASNTKADIARIKESMGIYSDKPNITLTAKENNVAISADGVKVSKQGWAIAEFTAELGNIYLFNPGETSSDVCVFAEYIDKVETRAIDYAYMYDESGRVLTAKATYNGKTYTYTYDYSSSITTITDQDGNNVSSLPSVYTTTVGAYQPMTILNANAELPEDGYCRFVSNFTTASAIKIVVSYKVLSADLTMKVVRDGSTANMCSQLAKINKKVDEVSEKVSNRRNSLSIRTKAYGTVIVVDGKKYTLDGKKTYSFPDFHTYQIEKNKLYIIRIDIDIFSRQIGGFSYNFNGFLSLSSLNVKCWDTSNVRDITNMFGDNSSLNHLDVSGWDTSNMTGMAGFCQNASVTELDVSGWDTSKVISLRHFAANSKITSLDVSGWDTSNVTDIANFCGGTKITSLDVSGWDTSNVTDMTGFCQNASVLTTLTFGEDFGKMTDKCGTLNLSTLSAWKNKSVKSLLTLYDRKANGMGVITIKLHANAKKVLGEDGIAQLTAKGYTIA